MLGENHDLLHELPEFREKIDALKQSNPEFARLYDAYHETNNEVERIEQGIETPSDEYTEEMKKKRLLLKDELFAILREA